MHRYGRPLKVPNDKGRENVRVWEEMTNHSPAGGVAVITGSSVHNQRVGRFNRDLNIHCADLIKSELYELEHQGLLDSSNDTYLFCLHYVYVPRINQLLQEFVHAHNHHSISTENNLTPRQLFNSNQHLLPLHSVKAWPNARNISTQHLATLLGTTCCMRLATLLRYVATCWIKFESSQIFRATF